MSALLEEIDYALLESARWLAYASFPIADRHSADSQPLRHVFLEEAQCQALPRQLNPKGMRRTHRPLTGSPVWRVWNTVHLDLD